MAKKFYYLLNNFHLMKYFFSNLNLILHLHWYHLKIIGLFLYFGEELIKDRKNEFHFIYFF